MMDRASVGGNMESFMYSWKGDNKLYWKENFPCSAVEVPVIYQRTANQAATFEEKKALFLKKFFQEYFKV